MAQASNAQREPSMEEILASIRRIIEDSDTGENVEAAATQQQPSETGEGIADPATGDAPGKSDAVEADAGAESSDEPENDAEAVGAAEADDSEIETFREELARGAEEQHEADRSMSALSLSDIGDEVARQSKPEAGGQQEETGEVAEAVETARDEDAEMDEQPDKDAGEGEIAAEVQTSGDEEDQEGIEPAAADETMDLAARSVTGAAADAAAPAAALARQTPGETGSSLRAPILSERAGRQVAAAFDELSEAFSQTRTKSFDQMAEDILRPMLQDWLDNNLPVLVERLVREEIDRVARGGSR